MDQLIYKRSFVVSLLHLFVGFILGLAVLGLVVRLIGALFGFMDLAANDWPVVINMMAENLTVMKEMIEPIDMLGSGQVMINRGELSFLPDQWPFYGLISVVFDFLRTLLLIAFLYNFRFVIASVEYGTPFTIINYKRLKYMAVLLVVSFVLKLTYSAVHHWYIINYVELANGEFISKVFYLFMPYQIQQLSADQILLENQHSLGSLVGAIFIYSLALVFKEGLRIKHDSDSIV